MLARVDVHDWNHRPTSLASTHPTLSIDADFDHQVRRLRQDLDERGAVRPKRVLNILVAEAQTIRDRKTPSLARPLRVTIEDFGPDGTIAYLVADRTFSGFGDNIEKAVDELMELVHHDFSFYESTPKDELTADAQESKTMLRRLFAELR